MTITNEFTVMAIAYFTVIHAAWVSSIQRRIVSDEKVILQFLSLLVHSLDTHSSNGNLKNRKTWYDVVQHRS